jgi:hypothetical protein
VQIVLKVTKSGVFSVFLLQQMFVRNTSPLIQYSYKTLLSFLCADAKKYGDATCGHIL